MVWTKQVKWTGPNQLAGWKIDFRAFQSLPREPAHRSLVLRVQAFCLGAYTTLTTQLQNGNSDKHHLSGKELIL